MELYQKIVLGIAIVLLITSYFMIYFTLVNNTKQWPPSVTKCPDYWVYDATTDKCVDGNDINNKYPTELDVKLTEKSNCDNYNWAKTNGISWEGLSYGVSMKCP